MSLETKRALRLPPKTNSPLFNKAQISNSNHFWIYIWIYFQQSRRIPTLAIFRRHWTLLPSTGFKMCETVRHRPPPRACAASRKSKSNLVDPPMTLDSLQNIMGSPLTHATPFHPVSESEISSAVFGGDKNLDRPHRQMTTGAVAILPQDTGHKLHERLFWLASVDVRSKHFNHPQSCGRSFVLDWMLE